jgi:hypothetical protein
MLHLSICIYILEISFASVRYFVGKGIFLSQFITFTSMAVNSFFLKWVILTVEIKKEHFNKANVEVHSININMSKVRMVLSKN